jgi:uncharacterized protein VirK/YbjX
LDTKAGQQNSDKNSKRVSKELLGAFPTRILIETLKEFPSHLDSKF